MGLLVQPMTAMDWVHVATIAHTRQHLHLAVGALCRAFREKIYAPTLAWLCTLAISNGCDDTVQRRFLARADAFDAFHSGVLTMELPHLGSVHTREAVRIL